MPLASSGSEKICSDIQYQTTDQSSFLWLGASEGQVAAMRILRNGCFYSTGLSAAGTANTVTVIMRVHCQHSICFKDLVSCCFLSVRWNIHHHYSRQCAFVFMPWLLHKSTFKNYFILFWHQGRDLLFPSTPHSRLLHKGTRYIS